MTSDTASVARNFIAIPDERHRAALGDVARALATAEPADGEKGRHAGSIVLAEGKGKNAA